ncbi:MAG: ABC transporter substrate-binding protein [Ancalomicrobiaceae bacterium]|nr:ABC transporter substrate-binding protein [Ancalomicrobiaceae bacterium]
MRLSHHLALLGTALVCLATPVQAAEKAEVLHWWTSGSESAAVNEFKKAFTAAGGEWTDAAVAGGGGETARAVGVNRIIGGNPTTAMQFNTSQQFYELIDKGLLQPLDAVAAKDNWAKVVNPVVLGAVTRNGHIYAVPVNIHSNNWLWFSPAALKKAGVEAPKTWDDFFTDLDALKKAGIIPLAQSGDSWTQQLTFFDVLLGAGGTELYLKIMKDHDVNAVKSPEFKKVADILSKMRDYLDEGMQGRQWNQAISLVISGQAGFNFMGDWAKGEVVVAGKVPGVDVGCIPGLGKSSYWIGGDVFVFPKQKDPNALKAQELLAHVMLSPEVQVAFNNKKGSAPVRADVDTSSMDACGKAGLQLLASGAFVPGSDMLIAPDTDGSIHDLIGTFFTDKSKTSADLVDGFAKIISNL